MLRSVGCVREKLIPGYYNIDREFYETAAPYYDTARNAMSPSLLATESSFPRG